MFASYSLSEFEIYHSMPSWPLEFGFRNEFTFISDLALAFCSFPYFFFVLYFQQFNYNMIWRGSFVIMSFLGSKCLLYLNIHVFPKIWETFCYCFTEGLPMPLAWTSAPSSILVICTFGLLSVSYGSCMFVHSYLSYLYFLYYYLNALIHQPCLQAVKP